MRTLSIVIVLIMRPQDASCKELEEVKERCYLLQAALDRTTEELRQLRGESPANGLGPSPAGEAMRSGGGGPGSSGSGRPPRSGPPSGADSAHDTVLASYIARVAELEKELRAARQFNSMRRRVPAGGGGSGRLHAGDPATPGMC